MYQEWPDQIFPIVNFVFSHYGHFGLGRGGGGFGGGVPPPWFLIFLKKPWGGEGMTTASIRTAVGIHLPGWESRMQLLPMASSPDGLISARYAVITQTPGWEVLTTTNVEGGGGGRGSQPGACGGSRGSSCLAQFRQQSGRAAHHHTSQITQAITPTGAQGCEQKRDAMTIAFLGWGGH